MNTEFIFFLGGHDAEMFAIREILQENKIALHDKGLSWGAKASDYKNELEAVKPGQIPVLVELQVDIQLPPGVIIIDHHNELSGYDKPTSIEQVADLLHYKLSRKQKLISVNDKAYIDGMKELGATDAEIKEIRTLDRLAQGVTEDDEAKAKLSIEKPIPIAEKILLIISQTEKTSPVIDLLYGKEFENIFIQTPSGNFSFFGSGEIVNILISKYKAVCKKEEELKQEKKLEYWYGGNMPVKGYFGANRALQIYEIRKIFEAKVYSSHIFIFPFRVDYAEFNTKPFLDFVKNKFEKHDFWQNKTEEKKGDTENEGLAEFVKNYNENTYFYKHVIDSLSYISDSNRENHNSIYTHTCEDDSYIKITVRYMKDEVLKEETYELLPEYLSLRFYDQGIGLLTLFINNTQYPELPVISRINDYGRRIYPQYINAPTLEHPDNLSSVKENFLPSKIEFYSGKIKTAETLDDTYYLAEKNKLPQYILGLLKPLEQKDIDIVIDDRMYTLCWYNNKEFWKRTSLFLNKKGNYKYYNYDKWYQFVYMDGNDPLIGSDNMLIDLIKKSTYERFVEWGTLYGITRYSFVALTNENPFSEIIQTHIKTIYYQLAVLYLVQRATVLKFFRDIEEISNSMKSELRDKKNNRLLITKVEKLNRDIIKFYDRFWFAEVTAQEQGIELYQMMTKNTGIADQIKDLRIQIEELHNYVSIVAQRMSADEIDAITRIGIIYLPFTLIAAIGAVEVYFNKGLSFGYNLFTLGIFVFSIMFISSLTKGIIRNLKHEQNPGAPVKAKNKKNDSEDNDRPLLLVWNAFKNRKTVALFLLWIVSLILYFLFK